MKRLVLALVILVTPFLFLRSYWSSLHGPVDPGAKVQVFVIKEGESVDSIAKRLEEQKLIRSAWIFKFELKRKGQDAQVDAGDFKLSASMPLAEVITTLTAGPLDRWVTLIEGLRVEEMAKQLADKLGVNSDEFIKAAKKYEGYLFPDTYLINPDVTIADIISILRNNFNKKYDDNLKAQIRSKGLTEKQGVILASIVEREARSDEARRRVASILLKRLKIGMGLNADATVQYALGYQDGEKSWWKRHLTSGDLKVNSPYNTYLQMGLPPTPIANPSLSALKAVANADPNTPYLYYYHDSKGSSHYATTLQEHNDNVANHP